MLILLSDAGASIFYAVRNFHTVSVHGQPVGQPPIQQPGYSPIRLPDPVPGDDMVRHMLFGSLDPVQATIRDLHARRYAEPNDWSRLLPTGRPNEVMAILTKRLRVVE